MFEESFNFSSFGRFINKKNSFWENFSVKYLALGKF